MNGPKPGKGIRGWSVSQQMGALRAGRAREERAVRGFLAARRGGIFRTIGFGVFLWAALTVLLSGNGVLRWQALKAREAELAQQHQALAREYGQREYELSENPNLSKERVLRERYRKSLKNEIVIYEVEAAADSVESDAAEGDSAAEADAGDAQWRSH